jgi:hypothetical protein
MSILLHVYTPWTLYASIGDLKQGSMGQNTLTRAKKGVVNFWKFQITYIYAFVLTI